MVQSLILSVNGSGIPSLWDSVAKAMVGKQPGEVVVNLTLTKHQMVELIRAEQLAKDKERQLAPHGR